MTFRCPECGSGMVVALVDAQVEMDMRGWAAEGFLHELEWSAVSFESQDMATTMVNGNFRAFACQACEHESNWTHSSAQQRALVKEWSEKED